VGKPAVISGLAAGPWPRPGVFRGRRGDGRITWSRPWGAV